MATVLTAWLSPTAYANVLFIHTPEHTEGYRLISSPFLLTVAAVTVVVYQLTPTRLPCNNNYAE